MRSEFQKVERTWQDLPFWVEVAADVVLALLLTGVVLWLMLDGKV